DYNIALKIGEVKGDGANGNVYIQLFGEKGDSSKINLRQAGDDQHYFKEGDLYRFTVADDDIGKIDRIKLSHDHMDYGSGFFVEEVEIDIPSRNDSYKFPCNFWLSQERHHMRPGHSTSTPPLTKLYNVSMQLGRVMNPHAKLYLQLCGDSGDSSKIVLRPTGGPTDTFQEGKVYRFSVEMPSVGKVDKIRIGHQNRGRNKGIYVDEVEVTPENEDMIFFPCGCWLAEDMGDGKLEREVYMGHAPAPMGTDATHTVSVRLGEVLNHYAQLYIYLIGIRGETSKVPLRPDGLLERTKTYQFPLALNVDIGQVEKIVLGQNSRGYGKGLFVEEVNVQPTGGDSVNFPCQCWLAEDVWDSKIERELLPGKQVEKAPNTTYELTFKTGDKPHAGTDANVTLQIFGVNGQTEKIMLRQSGRLNTLKRFDRGRTDRFDVQTLNVGKLTKIRLSHDNSNPDPEWFLDKLTISIQDIGETYHFPVERWLTEDEADALVEVEMEPTLIEPIVVVEKELPVQSEVDFTDLEPPKVLYTGPILDPYTSVYLIFHGKNGDSEKIYLNPPQGQELETSKVYKIITETTDVGQIHSATIGHDSPGPDKGVFIEEFDISAPAEKPVVFPCRCWLAEDVDDGETERTLRPGETLTYPYEITFTIGDVIDPHCKLYMMIYGTKGDSGKLYLSPSDGSEFVKGRTYKVIADLRDIGDVSSNVEQIYYDCEKRTIDEIRLGQEGDQGLFVEEIEIKAPNMDPVIFPCRCWLDESIDDGKTNRVLRPGQSVTFPYNISFTLGDVDPDAQLYMVIYGTDGDSGKLYLTPSDGSKFAKGQTYRVVVDVPDIGDIERIRLGQEGSDKGLFVEEVEIKAPGKDSVLFPCRCWVDNEERDLAPNETITPIEDTCLYNATFETGDVPFAGTDATVFLQMFGEEGCTDKIEFPQDDENTLRFEKGRMDKFAVETVDIGDLTKVRVGHDNTGHSPEWFLKQLTIDIPSKNKRYIFPYNNWIAGEDVDLEPGNLSLLGSLCVSRNTSFVRAVLREAHREPNIILDEKSKTELYTILLRLGDVLDPQTPVLVQLIGEKGESGKIQVKPGVRPTDEFEKGKTYKLIARVADIGRIKDVLVTQDESIPSEGLYVEEVEVTTSHGDCLVFPVHCWTGPDKGKEKDMLYDVTFKTGVLPDSGTSANVFFQIHGDEESTEEIQLQEDKSLDLFETGGTDKFKVETKDVGKIKRLRVGHDNTGPSPDWYLQRVNIDVPENDEHYQFNFNQWISGKNPVVEVAAGKYQKAPDRSEKLQDLDYRILVKTGDDALAGTDSNVFLQMFGEEGQSSKFLLREEGDTSRFARGKTDKFVIRDKDLGALEKINVCRDDTGSRSGWQLDKVTIDIPEKDEHYIFRCNRWLTAASPEADFKGVVCKVGDVLDPGVSPYFQIYGDDDETGRIMLRDGYPKQHAFKKGNTYKVSLKTPDVGEITKLRLGDDGGGRGRTIFVEEVSVIDKNGDEAVFPCNCWLGTDNDGRPIVRDLVPGESLPEDVDVLDIFYHMTIITADEPSSGTDSTVYFRLYGEKGETSDIVLEDERKTFKKFERGRADKFVVQTADVGKLEKMVIGHDNRGPDPSWLLEEVQVDIPSRNEHYVFKCGKWLRIQNGKDETEKVLYPDTGANRDTVDDRIEGVIDENLLQGAMTNDLFGDGQLPAEMDYKIDIKTADQPNAGTNAGVDCQLLGERGETDKVILGDKDGGQYFQSGQTDSFDTRGKNVGKLQYFRVGHDGSNASPDWLIDEVVVYVPDRNERYVFKNDRWIDNRDNPIDIPLGKLCNNNDIDVGKEPTIPDLLEFMKSGDNTKATHAAFYLQHLCYNDENVKNEVRELKGIPIIIECLYNNNENVRYSAACVLRNLSYSAENDLNKVAISDHGGIEALMQMLQRTDKSEHRSVALVVLRNLSVLEILRIKILRLCLHLLVIIIIKIFSGWDKTLAQREPPKMDGQWSELLEHATRIVRNISSAGIDARDAMRNEEYLIDCLVWIIRVGVKNKRYEDKIVRNSSSVIIIIIIVIIIIIITTIIVAIIIIIIIIVIIIIITTVITTVIIIIIIIVIIIVIIVAIIVAIIIAIIIIIVIIIIITTVITTVIITTIIFIVITTIIVAIIIIIIIIVIIIIITTVITTVIIIIIIIVIIITTCVENSVCTLRNLSYRLESELDRDLYDDAEVQLDKATVKEQQSQGCFAGCGGRKKKKAKSNIPIDERSRKGPPTGPALLYQSTTVRQYFILLRSAKNPETLEGSAGAIHNLTACSWKWAIKIRGDTRREQAIQHIISLLKTDYDPTIRASAIALRNLSVDPENKRIIGEKGIGPLVNRIPQGNERGVRLVKDATVVSILCALFQLGKKSEKNARMIKKTTGIRRMVRIAKSKNDEATKNKYDERVVTTANQTLASLWAHEPLKQQMKSEGWEYNTDNKSLECDFPEEFDKVSQPPTPSGSLNRQTREQRGSFSNQDPELHRIQRQPELYQRSPSNDQGDYRSSPADPRSTTDHSSRGSTTGSHADGSEWSGQQRSWGESINQLQPPPYQSDDNRSGKDFIEMSDRGKPSSGMKNGRPQQKHLQDNPNDWV
ncbi:hypothetical protein QZH41_014996, partial [Actinostola sp. cb2023]